MAAQFISLIPPSKYLHHHHSPLLDHKFRLAFGEYDATAALVGDLLQRSISAASLACNKTLHHPKPFGTVLELCMPLLVKDVPPLSTLGLQKK